MSAYSRVYNEYFILISLSTNVTVYTCAQQSSYLTDSSYKSPIYDTVPTF